MNYDRWVQVEISKDITAEGSDQANPRAPKPEGGPYRDGFMFGGTLPSAFARGGIGRMPFFATKKKKRHILININLIHNDIMINELEQQLQYR